MVELQPSKLVMRVRFPSPAPYVCARQRLMAGVGRSRQTPAPGAWAHAQAVRRRHDVQQRTTICPHRPSTGTVHRVVSILLASYWGFFEPGDNRAPPFTTATSTFSAHRARRTRRRSTASPSSRDHDVMTGRRDQWWSLGARRPARS